MHRKSGSKESCEHKSVLRYTAFISLLMNMKNRTHLGLKSSNEALWMLGEENSPSAFAASLSSPDGLTPSLARALALLLPPSAASFDPAEE